MDEESALAHQMAATMSEAMDANVIPLIMSKVHDASTPPPPEFFFGLMREMVESTGGVTGAVLFGTVDNTSGMVPHQGDVQGVLAGLLALRAAGAFDRVTWVALGADTWQRVYEVSEGEAEPDVRHGDLQQQALAGDPNVGEALVALCVAPDGPGYDLTQFYERTPDGIAWGEVENRRGPQMSAEGELPRLMSLLVQA